jgi:hypothetical protein
MVPMAVGEEDDADAAALGCSGTNGGEMAGVVGAGIDRHTRICSI